jgi:dTDP-glucose pyrophosphorylase
MRLILPCAGFGTRMGMDPNKSKELLDYKGNPLIEFSIEIAKSHNLSPLVITREEKTDLMDYCFEQGIMCQTVKVDGEWASTVLKSEPLWLENNILMLPDTIFSPVNNTIEEIKYHLNCNEDAVFALHDVDDCSKWGVIEGDTLYEKSSYTGPGKAWGIIGFKGYYGKYLFTDLTKGNSKELHNYSRVGLNMFKDLTRTGKIE